MVTVYGRMPVLEALRDPALSVAALVVARSAHGPVIEEIAAAAEARGLTVQRVPAERVTRISGNGRHDQGVVAHVAMPGLGELAEWLAEAPPAATVLVLDGVTNPANVGMVIRTATAAGLDAVVLPRAGSPDVGPLVVKASAGVVFRATVLRCPTARDGVELLRQAGFVVWGLAATARQALWDAPLEGRCALVLGSESEGISNPVNARLHRRVAIPLANDVESLNVAAAAAVVAFELARRRRANP